MRTSRGEWHCHECYEQAHRAYICEGAQERWHAVGWIYPACWTFRHAAAWPTAQRRYATPEEERGYEEQHRQYLWEEYGIRI